MSLEVAKMYGLRAQLDIMQEECAELIQACSKYNRARGFGYRTDQSVDESAHNLVKEMAQVQGCIADVMGLLDVSDEELNKIKEEANAIAYERAKAAKNENVKQKFHIDPIDILADLLKKDPEKDPVIFANPIGIAIQEKKE